MTPMKEIGECLVINGDDEYFFRPSLIAMSSIGDPVRLFQLSMRYTAMR